MKRIAKYAKAYVRGLGWRGWLHWFIIVVLIIALVKSCIQQKHDADTIADLKNVEAKAAPITGTMQEAEKIAEVVNKEGQAVATFKQAEPIIRLIEDKSKADSLAKVADVEKSKVTAITVINGTLTKENTDLKRYIAILENGARDTAFRYKDRWLTMEGFRKNDSTFTINRFLADASVNRVEHTRKKYWLVGKNENLSTIFYNSPYIRVDGLETLTIKQRDPFFTLDVNLEGKYLHTQKEILMGPKARVGLGRVGISGGYYLNPAGKIGNGVWYGLDWKLY